MLQQASGFTFALPNLVENLTLSGPTVSIGTGNSLNNVIVGNSLNNTIDGLVGADTMIGGTGSDTYRVDNVGDVVIENANEGTDTVQSSIDYTLGNDVENLTLRSGTAAVSGTATRPTTPSSATRTTTF